MLMESDLESVLRLGSQLGFKGIQVGKSPVKKKLKSRKRLNLEVSE